MPARQRPGEQKCGGLFEPHHAMFAILNEARFRDEAAAELRYRNRIVSLYACRNYSSE